MRKICIIGCGGSGKSTLATTLNSELNIPVFHLDALYWQPNWTKIDKMKWLQLQANLCSQPEWIIDGNYGGTIDIRLNASDAIIFLDFPVYICLWRVLKRQIKYIGKTRPDMGKECRERFSFAFIWWVVGYAKTKRPQIMAKLSELREKQIFILKSKKEVDRFISNIK
jgi:adenylate kinase family enzyme